jgi:DNA-binding winged helix-turn-helix (wHTH) protein
VKTQFGPFVFDRAHQLLAREGQEVPLPPRVLGVLDVLTARPGQIVSREELI